MAIEYTPESSLVADPAEGGSFSASNNAELAGAQSFAAQAKLSETAAATSETNSANSATASAGSATAASGSATQSADSATASATSATQSATSATASANSATASANSATAAATSETNASTSATTATTKESEASTSATNASTSETNAGTSATAASNSATAAATSATSASGSATTATTKASEASTSETNAGTSATDSATSATASANSATAAATSATNAGTSETAAATSATNAATSATASANSATASAGSATNASNSATSAGTAQTAAEAARDAALAAFDSFDDRYLGPKASDPTTDNDGDALASGMLYFNTSTDDMKVYEGSSWVNAYASLSGALIATNNLSDLNNAATARTNLGLGTAATTAASDYATAAQGTTADNALPKSGGAMTGAITTNSTFDGRDVATDGTKLDGIEAGATADQTAAEIKTAYESNADTNAFTDADHTKVDGIEAGADVTDTTNVVAALSAGTGISLSNGGVIANTSLDQTVALTGAGATSISGTYPNFTITSTDTNTDTNTTYTAGTGITLTGTEFSIGQGVATTDSPTFAAINVNGLVTSDDFQIDLGTVTASAQITTPSSLSGFQAFYIKNTHTEGYLSFGTTLGQARINAMGPNGSADPLNIDVGSTTAIGINTSGHVSFGGSTGYFYNDSGARTAYTGGDFYIQSGVTNYYNYATNQYLGNTSGDTINFRGNDVTHNGWHAQSDGHIRMNDSQHVRFGNAGDVELFFSGTHFYMDLNSGGNNFYIRDGSTTRFTFDDNGSFTATGNVTAYSDRRLKDDIQPIEGALEKVGTLSGNTYQRNDLLDKDPERRYAGVIAQEVEVVLPEAVSEAEDGTKTVDYNAVIALLVESIKELKAEVEQLKGGS